MSLEENKAIVRTAVEALNKQDLAALDDFFSSNYVDHTNQLRGLEDIKKFYTRAFEGFPDFYRTIEDITAEGDKVWVRVKVTGTHTGEYRGLTPTGEKIKVTYVGIHRIAEGKVVERWSVYDLLDFYKELGVIKYKGFPEE